MGREASIASWSSSGDPTRRSIDAKGDLNDPAGCPESVTQRMSVWSVVVRNISGLTERRYRSERKSAAPSSMNPLHFVTVLVTVTECHGDPRRCKWCRERFTPSRRGRAQLYCCRSHRQRAYEQRKLRAATSPTLMLSALRSDMRDLLRGNQTEHDRLKLALREILIELVPSLEPYLPRPRRPKLTLVKNQPKPPENSRTPEGASPTRKTLVTSHATRPQQTGSRR